MHLPRRIPRGMAWAVATHTLVGIPEPVFL